MRVVVTGGAGFIGANLCSRLLENGYEVTVLDNLSTGALSNLDGLEVQFVEGDIRDRFAVRDVMKGAATIVHLAARGSVPRSVAEPLESHDVNVNGTLNVLEAARASRLHVIFSSSSSVYGANRALPKSETMRTEPMSPYAASKLAGEAYALSYRRVYSLEVLVFRFFNVYGPLQPAGHAYAAVIPAFVDAMLAGRSVPVYGDGRQSRDFTSVQAVVDVICDAVARRVCHDGPVNLAFNTSTTLLQLIGVLEQLTGLSAEVEFLPARAGDVRASQADPSLLYGLFPNARPQDLARGLAETVAWFRKAM